MSGPLDRQPTLATDDPAPPTNAALAIGLLVGSAFVMILNETIMSVALPALVADLDVTIGTAQWLTSGFLLTMAVVIPITGFLLQRFPPRQVYLASMTLFSVGTLIAALAPGFPMLMAGRVVQAAGTAVMIPLLMTSVIRLVPAERRGATMGTITVVIAVAPAIGPTLSGIILTTLGWRWMFWIVLPIALIALAAGARWLRVRSESRPVPLDLLSVALSATGLRRAGVRAEPARRGGPRHDTGPALAADADRRRWPWSPSWPASCGCSPTAGRCWTCGRWRTARSCCPSCFSCWP